MTSDDIIRMAQEAGWSGTYVIQWADEPTGEPDWNPVKESMPVPVTMEQIERFAALVVAAERERIKAANAPVIQRINEHIKMMEEAAAAEREACAKVCDDKAKETFSGQCQVWGDYFARAIRARGNT